MAESAHIIFRSFLFFSILFLMTKIVGKKQISQLTFFEYVSGITVGSIAAEVIMGLDNNIFHGIYALAVFGIVTIFVDFTSLRSKKFRDIVEGSSTVFIQDGKIQEDNLKKERYSTDELASLLRKQNVFRVADVEFAVLEPTGDLSVLLKKENQPLTAKALQFKVPNEKEPQTVIMDGKILNDPLARSGKNRGWLFLELEKQNVTLENVFFGQIDANGELTVDIFDDKIQVPASQEKPLVMAQLKKCQADLESFALGTDSKEAKKMYQRNSKRISEAIEKLKPYLNG